MIDLSSNKRFFDRYTIFELVAIAVVAALGVATKPIVVPLVHIITGPLFIPGGAIAGGFYMLWIILGIGFVKKTWTGTLIGLVQGLIVVATGVIGSHGVLSIFSYTLPGVVADLVFMFSRNKSYNLIHFMLGCMAANITGTIISNLLFFRLPAEMLLLLISGAALSGALGGVIAWNLLKALDKLGLNL
ncbi:ECF transporter S component [Gudongella oleilytica]|jgi:energy-coupling factor transport system substrate-specific component|uniref:ECF transporter S component n=1 Tax=Gudongella oleilytica TaxID=1582259 RepID=UPI000FF89A73|nr:ECF transporter S component [Gudongella oleilytica]MDY0257144.1 ECF transporter S component [Gudongella oleilytica]HMM69749.1 ECF transporter S component [Gudongella oleilytica]